MDPLRRSRSTNDLPSHPFQPPQPPAPVAALAPAAQPNNNQALPGANFIQNLGRTPSTPSSSSLGRALAFLGYGRDPSLRPRRALVSVIVHLAIYSIQFVVIIAFLIVAGVRKSPTEPTSNEWQACARPLGIWGVLWILRICLAAILSYWDWRRSLRAPDHRNNNNRHTNPTRDVESRPQPPPLTASQSAPALQGANLSDSSEPPPLPHSRLFSRLSVLLSLLTLTWFLTAHILEYTTINTCRHSSPHLFWLIFGILCLLYFMVLEVIVLGFTVFIVAPLVFLFWNLILFMLGRHPLQNTDIKPEIGKLPKAVVDRIPLVIYIPPPPEDAEAPSPSVSIPQPIYTYPPKPNAPTKPRRRFKFLRRKRDSKSSPESKGNNLAGGDDSGPAETWESNWEPSEYPFVRLDGNRAVCSICLMDFEEPKRAPGKGNDPTETSVPVVRSDGAVEEVPVEAMTDAEHEAELRLADAGEGSQPLRLLACGHAFHKTCIDPWLIEVSGRCAVCQRPVEVPPEETKSSPRRWFRRRRS